MRTLALVALALLLGSCWTPGPGQIDPTRYPWDQPRLKRTPQQMPSPVQESYCVIMLETPASTGITAGGANGVNLTCKPGARIVPLGGDDPDDGIETRSEAEGTAFEPLRPLPQVAAPAPPRRDPTPRERFAADCADHAQRLARLARYGFTASRNGSAHIARATWQAMPMEDQHQLIWNLAFHASCAAGKRKMVEVRILDESGRLIRRQPASTELVCRGDRIGGPPEAPWYLC